MKKNVNCCIHVYISGMYCSRADMCRVTHTNKLPSSQKTDDLIGRRHTILIVSTYLPLVPRRAEILASRRGSPLRHLG